MKVAIVFDGRGAPAAAAEQMAEMVRASGHQCTVESVASADPAKVGRSDAICIGTPTIGFHVIAQRPTDAILDFISRLSLNGKPVAVFTTYSVAIGGTLRTMAGAVEASGGTVTGMYRSRGPKAAGDFQGWVRSLEV